MPRFRSSVDLPTAPTRASSPTAWGPLPWDVDVWAASETPFFHLWYQSTRKPADGPHALVECLESNVEARCPMHYTRFSVSDSNGDQLAILFPQYHQNLPPHHAWVCDVPEGCTVPFSGFCFLPLVPDGFHFPFLLVAVDENAIVCRARSPILSAW